MENSADRLRKLVHAGAEDELGREPLAPDGDRQPRRTTLRALSAEVSRELAGSFGDRPPEDFPVLVLAWGKARVGTTAMAHLFAAAGVPVYRDPVRTIARHVLTGTAGPVWAPPDGEEVLFATESTGPHLHCEALFDPLRCLVDAGWPRERLQLLILDRDPAAVLDAWLLAWADEVGRQRVVDNFHLSTLNYRRMRASGRNCGVRVTHYVHEAGVRSPEAEGRLFRRLGLAHRYEDAVAHGRLTAPPSGEGHRGAREASLTPEDKEFAHGDEIQATYRHSLRKCARDLGLLHLAWPGVAP